MTYSNIPVRPVVTRGDDAPIHIGIEDLKDIQYGFTMSEQPKDDGTSELQIFLRMPGAVSAQLNSANKPPVSELPMEDLFLHLQSRMVIALHVTVQPHNLNAFDWSRCIWARAGMAKAELARLQREADAVKGKQTEQAGALQREIDTAGTFGL